MLYLKGTLQNVLKQSVKTKDGKEFDTITLQIMEQFNTGRTSITDVQVGKERHSKIAEYKVGSEVTIPVSIEISADHIKERIYRKYWLAS